MIDNFNSIKVNIAGNEYTIKSDLDVEQIEAVAGYVNEKISDIGSGQTSRERYRIAILAAIQIAGELFEERAEGEKHSETLEQFNNKTRELNKKLDLLQI